MLFAFFFARFYAVIDRQRKLFANGHIPRPEVKNSQWMGIIQLASSPRFAFFPRRKSVNTLQMTRVHHLTMALENSRLLLCRPGELSELYRLRLVSPRMMFVVSIVKGQWIRLSGILTAFVAANACIIERCQYIPDQGYEESMAVGLTVLLGVNNCISMLVRNCSQCSFVVGCTYHMGNASDLQHRTQLSVFIMDHG